MISSNDVGVHQYFSFSSLLQACVLPEFLMRSWQRNGWGRAVVQLCSILSMHLILQGTSVDPPPLQIQEPLGQYVDVASRLLQSRVQQSPLNQTLLKASRTFAHRSHKTCA